MMFHNVDVIEKISVHFLVSIQRQLHKHELFYVQRQNVRNHLIRISFYDSSDHCQIPQKNKERHFKHSKRRFLSAFYTPWKQQSSNFTLSIGTVFQQKTALPHTKYIADKCIKQKQKHKKKGIKHILNI